MIKAISMLGNTEAPTAPATTTVTNPQEAPKVEITPPQDTFVPSKPEEAPPQADPNDKFVKTEEQAK
jgi:hypothetical protein